MSLDIFWFLPTSGDTRYLGKQAVTVRDQVLTGGAFDIRAGKQQAKDEAAA